MQQAQMEQQQQLQQDQMAIKEEGNNYRAELKAQQDAQRQAPTPPQEMPQEAVPQ